MLVRADEILVSFAVIGAVLDRLPKGRLSEPIVHLPGNRAGFAVTESPRGENLHWVKTNADGTIGRYRVRSASYANWAAVTTTVPGNMVPDFPLINKSFELCYACNDR